MRLREAVIVLAVASVGVGWLPNAANASTDSPDAVVDQTYELWQSALGARQECASGAAIVLEALSGRRGEYRPATRQVVLDPRSDPGDMAGVLIHELAHHAFLSCGVFADQDFTDAFYAAQALPADRDWFDYTAGWSLTPAEQFAEATAVAITGRGEGGIEVTTEAADLISRWLAGAPLSRLPAQLDSPEPYAENDVSVRGNAGGDRSLTQVESAATPSARPEPAAAEPSRAPDINSGSEDYQAVLGEGRPAGEALCTRANGLVSSNPAGCCMRRPLSRSHPGFRCPR